jgi:hypothetical protein
MVHWRQFCVSLKDLQGNTKLSPVNHMVHRILVLVQKDSNAKKESYFYKEPENLDQFYHSNPWKRKKKINFFYLDNFVLP